MQTLTFTQKLLRQRRFLSSLIPLFALFVGLGAANSASAQSTINFRNVRVTSGTNTSTATTSNYNADDITSPGPGVFDGTDFNTLEFGLGQLLLQGGSIEVFERNGDYYPTAYVTYGVKSGTLATIGRLNVPPLSGSIQLVETNYNAATSTRTFALSNAAIDILALATSGGNPGTSYRFDVSVSTGPGEDINGRAINPLLGERRRSVFTATGTPVFTPTLTATTIFILPNGTSNVTYDANNMSVNPDFNNSNLGAGFTPPTFDVNNGQLLLNGGSATTRENGNNTISNVTLYYRVRGAGTGGSSFSPVVLTPETPFVTNADGSRTRFFSLSAAARNLLAGIGMLGVFNVDVYFQASGANSGTNTTFLITDNNNNNDYVANFTVAGTVFPTTTWTGGLNDNWFDTANWDNGVPSATKNAIIPNFPSATGKPYPNVYSDAIKVSVAAETVTNPDGSSFIIPASPGYNNSTSGNAMARNLTLQGNTQLDRSIVRLVRGRLDVFGDFTNPQGSFIQRSGTTISFKGGNQAISGNVNGFYNVEIDGIANSVKTLTNNFSIKPGASLKFINGILQTNIALVSSNFVALDGAVTDPSNSSTVPAAQLIDETEASFFRGFMTTAQPATPGVAQDFSNMGITITFTGNNPGNVTVTRNNGGNYPASAFGGGANNPNTNPTPSIRRVFGVQPGNPNALTGGLSGTVAFHYLDNELTNVRNSDGTTTSLDKSRLALYVSTTGGDSFIQLGRTTHNTSTNVLTKTPVTTFATFTLSEATIAPLPVTLTKFDAQRVGENALVTWQTAAELNSKGYNVQVSTDGREFHTVGFVASASPNSMKTTNYAYTDGEKNKVGLRYYRLEQVDVDGTLAYSVIKVISFNGKDAEGLAFAYPNPYVSEVSLKLKSTSDGQGVVNVMDVTGRVVNHRQISFVTGSNDVSLSGLENLKGGIYMMQVTLPSGQVQNLRVVKNN